MSKLGCVARIGAAGVLSIAIAGCGSAGTGSTAAAQVVSGTCGSSGVGGRTVSESCQFVLSDGRRFGCRHELKGQPAEAELRQAGCVKLPSLRLSATQRSTIAAVFTAGRCLTARELRTSGGPVLPASARTPDGELVVTSAHPTFIAFYSDVAKANRLESMIVRNARAVHAQVERRDAVTIIWTRAPASGLRRAVEGCVFR